METNTMAAIKIADNVYAVGVKDPGLTMFYIVMETKLGTTRSYRYREGGVYRRVSVKYR